MSLRLIILAFAVLATAAADAGEAPAPKDEPARIRDLVTIAGAAPKKLAARARATLAGIDDAKKVGPLMAVLDGAPERLRHYAVLELGRIKHSRSLGVLLYRSLADSSRRVREASLDGAKVVNEARTVRWLVYRFEAHGGASPRSYIQIGTQASFVKDFDAEVG